MLNVVEQELRLAKNQQLPRLDLSVAASHSAGEPRAYSEVDESVSETAVGGKLTFSFDVQRRKARGKAHALRAKQRQIEAELRQVQDTIQIEVLSAHEVLHAQYQAVLQSHEATELARQVAQAEADSLLAGQSTVMSVNIREQAVLKAQLAELEAMHLLQGAWIEMQRARGKTEPEAYILPEGSAEASGSESEERDRKP
jgi:outer membrane protein TolC